MSANPINSVLSDIVRTAYDDDVLLVKEQMTNRTTNLLLRLVRLITVRKGTTVTQFQQRHRVWFNGNRKAQHAEKNSLNADRNSRLKVLTKQDTDGKDITWSQATKLLEIEGCDIRSITIEYFDKTTGESVSVSSSSNFAQEDAARRAAQKLPSISTIDPKDL